MCRRTRHNSRIVADYNFSMRFTALVVALSLAAPAFAANRVKDNLQWGMLTREGKEAMRTRNFADAEKKLKQALQVAATFDDEDPVGVAVSKENLARVYVEQKMFSKAEPLMLDAIARRERQRDADPVELASKLEETGDFFVSADKPAKSEAWFAKAIETLDGVEEPDYHVKGVLLLKLSEIQLVGKKAQAAHDGFVKSRETYAKSPAGTGELEDQRFLSRSLSGQAGALAALGKHADAKTFHLKAIAVAEKNFPNEGFLAAILEAAARDLRKIDKTEAAKLDVRAKEIRRASFE